MENSNKPKPKRNEKQKRHLIPKKSRITTAEEFEKGIEEYFKLKKKDKKPPTIAGLARHLGFESRNALSEYEKIENHKDIEEKEKIAIACTIKKARLRIEEYLEENLIEGKQVAGTIFNLKNNFGYVDRTEQEHKGDLIIQIEGIDKF